MIQLLPPRQRAVLILRDVLDWPASDVAELLELGVAAVNSALQRARATLREQLPADRREDWAAPEVSETERALLAGFIDTHERGDAEGALALISDDIRVDDAAAPAPVRGPRRDRGPDAHRVRPGVAGRVAARADRANRQPAAASYLRAHGETCSARSSSTCCASRTAGSPRSRRSTPRSSTRSACRRRSTRRSRGVLGVMTFDGRAVERGVGVVRS